MYIESGLGRSIFDERRFYSKPAVITTKYPNGTVGITGFKRPPEIYRNPDPVVGYSSRPVYQRNAVPTREFVASRPSFRRIYANEFSDDNLGSWWTSIRNAIVPQNIRQAINPLSPIRAGGVITQQTLVKGTRETVERVNKNPILRAVGTTALAFVPYVGPFLAAGATVAHGMHDTAMSRKNAEAQAKLDQQQIQQFAAEQQQASQDADIALQQRIQQSVSQQIAQQTGGSFTTSYSSTDNSGSSMRGGVMETVPVSQTNTQSVPAPDKKGALLTALSIGAILLSK